MVLRAFYISPILETFAFTCYSSLVLHFRCVLRNFYRPPIVYPFGVYYGFLHLLFNIPQGLFHGFTHSRLIIQHIPLGIYSRILDI